MWENNCAEVLIICFPFLQFIENRFLHWQKKKIKHRILGFWMISLTGKKTKISSHGYKWAHVMKNEIRIVRKALWELSWLTLCIMCQITESRETGLCYLYHVTQHQHSSACGQLPSSLWGFFYLIQKMQISCLKSKHSSNSHALLLCLQMGPHCMAATCSANTRQQVRCFLLSTHGLSELHCCSCSWVMKLGSSTTWAISKCSAQSPQIS